jgi:hypothetical protein
MPAARVAQGPGKSSAAVAGGVPRTFFRFVGQRSSLVTACSQRSALACIAYRAGRLFALLPLHGDLHNAMQG